MECGLPPNGPGRIVYSDDAKRFPNNPDELCPGCSRPLWFVIEVVAGSEGGEGGLLG